MSLRVLLADESASIRKVFQMGLQDFGAEVKSVHNGLDVIEVAETFRPHIVFVDILLQKKNGYEVSEEMANHQTLSETPVVLMWSSFMELDHKKYQSCGAKQELEKPFDVENMRNIIQSLVNFEEPSPVSTFLDFPKSITQEFVDEEGQKLEAHKITTDVKETDDGFTSQDDQSLGLDLALQDTTDQEMEQSEEHEVSSIFNTQVEQSGEFEMYEVNPPAPPRSEDSPQADKTTDSPAISDEENWQSQPLQDQKMATKTEIDNDQDWDQFQSMDLGKNDKINLDDFLYKPDSSKVPPLPENTNTNSINQHISNVRVSGGSDELSGQEHLQVSPAEIEAIVLSETRKALKGIIEQQLPNLLESVIRKELESLLQQELALKNPASNP